MSAAHKSRSASLSPHRFCIVLRGSRGARCANGGCIPLGDVEFCRVCSWRRGRRVRMGEPEDGRAPAHAARREAPRRRLARVVLPARAPVWRQLAQSSEHAEAARRACVGDGCHTQALAARLPAGRRYRGIFYLTKSKGRPHNWGCIYCMGVQWSHRVRGRGRIMLTARHLILRRSRGGA